jgi:6-phosphogluconolactonase/glucosamine-6-phosphate isomerase/deaminase
MTVEIYADADTLSQAAARYVVSVANESIVTHGRFTLSLAGGSTPKKLYSLLASEPYRDQINWALVEVFWSDERCVPPDSEDSNYHLAEEVLLSKVPIPASQIHRMPADAADRRFIFRCCGLLAFALFQFQTLRERRDPSPDGAGTRPFELGLETLQFDF